jgi:hypothetical protein
LAPTLFSSKLLKRLQSLRLRLRWLVLMLMPLLRWMVLLAPGQIHRVDGGGRLGKRLGHVRKLAQVTVATACACPKELAWLAEHSSQASCDEASTLTGGCRINQWTESLALQLQCQLRPQLSTCLAAACRVGGGQCKRLQLTCPLVSTAKALRQPRPWLIAAVLRV